MHYRLPPSWQFWRWRRCTPRAVSPCTWIPRNPWSAAASLHRQPEKHGGAAGTVRERAVSRAVMVSGGRFCFGNPAQQRERLFTGLEMRPHGSPRLLGIALAERGQDLRMVFVGFVLDARQLLRFGDELL